MKIDINHGTIRALLLCAAKDDLRTYLNSIYIDATGDDPAHPVVLVAATGTVLLAVPVQAADVEGLQSGGWIVPRSLWESVKPAKVGRTVLPLVATVGEGDAQTVTLVGATQGVATVGEGRYPDWRRVMPENPTGEMAQYDPALVGVFADVAKHLDARYPYLRMNGTNPARWENLNGAYGVMMPWRNDATEPPGLPTWAKHSTTST